MQDRQLGPALHVQEDLIHAHMLSEAHLYEENVRLREHIQLLSSELTIKFPLTLFTLQTESEFKGLFYSED